MIVSFKGFRDLYRPLQIIRDLLALIVLFAGNLGFEERCTTSEMPEKGKPKILSFQTLHGNLFRSFNPIPLKCSPKTFGKLVFYCFLKDEKYLIWYSGQEERQLKLSSVITVVRGQITVSRGNQNRIIFFFFFYY